MNRAPFHELTGRTDRTSEARVSGEAPAALLPEGVLNPINGTSAATHVALPRHALWGVMTWVPGENRGYHVGRERGGRAVREASRGFAAGGGAEPTTNEPSEGEGGGSGSFAAGGGAEPR